MRGILSAVNVNTLTEIPFPLPGDVTTIWTTVFSHAQTRFSRSPSHLPADPVLRSTPGSSPYHAGATAHLHPHRRAETFFPLPAKR